MNYKPFAIVAAMVAVACSQGTKPTEKQNEPAPAEQTPAEQPVAEPVVEAKSEAVDTLQDEPKGNAEALAAAKPFLGKWGAGRCTIDITDMYDGAAFAITIYWASNAAEFNQWDYVCSYDAATNSLVADKTGRKVTTVFTDEEHSTETVNYEDGSATFSVENEMLKWVDQKENIGKDMEIVKAD